VSDWYQDEQPMFEGVVDELQRLKRRARARLIWVVVIAVVLTAGLLYKRSRKVKVHEATVVLAVSDGSLAQSRDPMPVRELRNYIVDVLLSDAAIATIVEKHDLTPLRSKFGMPFAVGEFRDALSVGVARNYFLYEYSIDAPRSARIAIEYADPDPELSWQIAHEVADLIVAAQRERTLRLAEDLSREAQRALDEIRGEAEVLEAETATSGVALARAENESDPGRLASLRVHHAELENKLYRLNERIAILARQADADQTVAAVVRAGLAMSFEIAYEERPHQDPPPPLYFQIIFGGVLFCIILPAVALFVGAFDTRVHDREDVERIGLPVLGHLPGFPGDGIGSLRSRGVRRRRVPS
jgi:hypothetical protein